MLSDWLEEFRVPVLIAEKHDLEESKSKCLSLINKLNIGWDEEHILKSYTISDDDEKFIKLSNSVFPILISKESLEKYKLKYLLKLAIDFLDEQIENDNELIKIEIVPE